EADLWERFGALGENFDVGGVGEDAVAGVAGELLRDPERLQACHGGADRREGVAEASGQLVEPDDRALPKPLVHCERRTRGLAKGLNAGSVRFEKREDAAGGFERVLGRLEDTLQEEPKPAFPVALGTNVL